MKVVIQRVLSSRVEVAHQVVGSIDRGLMILVGIAANDTEADVDWMVKKCLGLRLFPSPGSDRFDCSVTDIQGSILVVSQFTLYGDCRKGRRPSFAQAASPPAARLLYDQFVQKLRQSSLHIETGQFGADMNVVIENDGPVTILLETDAGQP